MESGTDADTGITLGYVHSKLDALAQAIAHRRFRYIDSDRYFWTFYGVEEFSILERLD